MSVPSGLCVYKLDLKYQKGKMYANYLFGLAVSYPQRPDSNSCAGSASDTLTINVAMSPPAVVSDDEIITVSGKKSFPVGCGTGHILSLPQGQIRSCILLIISKLQSLPDAEGGEDQIQDVVGGGLAGQGIEGPESAIEIEQDHLVRDGGLIGAGSICQRGHCGND